MEQEENQDEKNKKFCFSRQPELFEGLIQEDEVREGRENEKETNPILKGMTQGLTFFGGLVLLLIGVGLGRYDVVGQLGDLVGGVAGGLALLWLIHSVGIQSKQLKVQQKELEEQVTQMKLAGRMHAEDFIARLYAAAREQFEAESNSKLKDWRSHFSEAKIAVIYGDSSLDMREAIGQVIGRIQPFARLMLKLKSGLTTYWEVLGVKFQDNPRSSIFFCENRQLISHISALISDAGHITRMAELLRREEYSHERLWLLWEIADYFETNITPESTVSWRIMKVRILIRDYNVKFGSVPIWVDKRLSALIEKEAGQDDEPSI